MLAILSNPSFLRPNVALSLRQKLCYTVRKSAEGGLSYGTQTGICRVLHAIRRKAQGSLCNAAKAIVEVGGANKVYACASHGVLSGPAIDRLESSNIEELALLDTIPAHPEAVRARIKYLSVASMFSEAIERTYQEVSISKLFR